MYHYIYIRYIVFLTRVLLTFSNPSNTKEQLNVIGSRF